MNEEPRDLGASEPDDAADAETEYPKSPGASKMGALERIERSLERQSEDTPGRKADADARQGDDNEEDADAAGDSGR